MKKRDKFLTIVKSLTGSVTDFINSLDEEHSKEYDVYLSLHSSNYIIERKTGMFVSWQTLHSLGRDLHLNFPMYKMKSFLKRYLNIK